LFDESRNLAGERILLGVSGGIAAYKAAELVRRLRDAEAEVRVVLTEAAAGRPAWSSHRPART
jgi:phosphopantothenoylcysteine decarboxylase/phosphopantothenate--cysteine ligase